jgi:hypothetical protein
MRKHLVIETFFAEVRQNFYYLMLPDVREDGFYRAVSSYNAFFNGMRNPKANVTEVRQFTSDHEIGIQVRKQFLKNVDWDNLRTFQSIWEFYDFIGYDHKARKYKSGEVMKVWNGQHFVLPARRKRA